jgi:prepilin-type N-terminal cleavage/methylation domain-containing protein
METNRSLKESGFTIVEILVALVVLSVGLLGILAVFPAGIKKTSEVVQSTIAAMTAESVRSSIELGLHKARIRDGGDLGFIYLGEGVKRLVEDSGGSLTDLAANPPKIDKGAPYWVLLPVGEERRYLYPRNNPATYDIGQRTPAPYNNPRVLKVFPLGEDILKIREGKVPDEQTGTLTVAERRDAERDPLPQYSYAFTIEEAKIDRDGDRIPESYTDDHSLYKITVYVYRNFPTGMIAAGNQDAAFATPNHHPVQTFAFLVAF